MSQAGEFRLVQETPSLRDFFAAAALTGAIPVNQAEFDQHEMAETCYRMADAMLAQRQRKEEE